jgi:hypothetical protein
LSEFITKAVVSGSERVIAWADVLDRINVFPVPDGDTGRNLVFSLSPLRRLGADVPAVTQELLMSARGNSGNIAARFFSGFIACAGFNALAECCRRGRDLAYQAVPDPKPGTMLSLFDALVEALEQHPPEGSGSWVGPVVTRLENEVRSTTERLPELKNAGVVDAGALGMFIFFDACFNTLTDREAVFTPVAETFRDSLELAEHWQDQGDHGYCLDVVLQMDQGTAASLSQVYTLGESVVTITDGDYLKVHLHAGDAQEVRKKLGAMGNIVRWSSDDLTAQTKRFAQPKLHQALHIMTDAAGSVTREDAVNLGITLLDSYINVGEHSLPETYVDPGGLFEAMGRGVKVSTSQASMVERHQCYHKALNLYPRVLYLCVGSFFTGNYRVAMDWKAEHDPEDRLVVVDTGSASGRLGLAAIATARRSLTTTDAQEVIDYGRWAAENCREFIFLDKLQYLAAGGRLSKTSAFFGDMLKMKPVVSPQPEGAKKVAVVRHRKDQLEYALSRLEEGLNPLHDALIMLEYTDTEEWLRGQVKPIIEKRFPRAEVLFRPISLTTGSHVGPGSWAIAFMPQGR